MVMGTPKHDDEKKEGVKWSNYDITYLLWEKIRRG